jgi:hypothetical protein
VSSEKFRNQGEARSTNASPAESHDRGFVGCSSC